MNVSTIFFIDGEERQVYAESLQLGAPMDGTVRIELENGGEMIVPLTSIKNIVTEDIGENAISSNILGRQFKT